MREGTLLMPARASRGLGHLLFLLGATGVVFGLLFQSSHLAGFGAVLLALPLSLYLSLHWVVRRVDVHRIAPEAVFEDEPIDVRIRITNRSRLPIFFPRVSEIFPPEIHSQKDLVLTDRLDPGESAERSYAGFSILPRGIYPLGPSVLRISDPFGWFEVRGNGPPGQAIKIYPAIRNIEGAIRIGSLLCEFAPEYSPSGSGESDEFLGVREYRPGDPSRRVHWGLTARRGFPVVREFAPPRRGDLHVFIDLQRRALVGAGRSSSLETGIRIAASLVAHEIEAGRRVQVVTGPRPLDRVVLGGGRRQLQQVLELLVGLKPQDALSYPELLQENLTALEAGSTAVLNVSPYLYANPLLLRAVGSLTHSGVRVIAVIYDASTFQRICSDSGSSVAVDRALEDLGAKGAECTLVPCASDLERVFSRYAS